MKRILILLLLSVRTLSMQAQQVQQITDLPIDRALPQVDLLMKDQITDQVKLIGIGDIGTLVKESQQFDVNLSAWLISKKNFRNIIVATDEWKLRPLNNYLTGKTPRDTAVMDSLIGQGLDGVAHLQTYAFRSFLDWLKTYNLSHPQVAAGLYGSIAEEKIPPSYFLAAYIYPADKATGAKLANKWDEEEYNEARSFKDIEQWRVQAGKTKLTVANKELVKKCFADLAHNKAVYKVTTADQVVPKDTTEKYAAYSVGRIMELTNTGRTILFGANTSVVKSDYQNKYVAQNQPMPTTGKLLHTRLKDAYYVCATDFADTAHVLLADLATRQMNLETLTGAPTVKQMLSQKDSYFTKNDQKILQKFLPVYIPFIKERKSDLVIDEAIIPVDALFIFKTLSRGKHITER